MKNLKKKVTVLTVVSMFSLGSAATVLAADYQTPAEAAASVTGKEVEDVVKERMETGKTFGSIAAESGKLEEFKKLMLEAKEKILSEDVEKGVITQEEADDILDAVKERQAACDGTGYGQGGGYGFGGGCGLGRGYGRGAGFGRRNGSCMFYSN